MPKHTISYPNAETTLLLHLTFSFAEQARLFADTLRRNADLPGKLRQALANASQANGAAMREIVTLLEQLGYTDSLGAIERHGALWGDVFNFTLKQPHETQQRLLSLLEWTAQCCDTTEEWESLVKSCEGIARKAAGGKGVAV